MPHWWPFHPSNPSILKDQNPVVMSLMTIKPSALRTSTPNAPLQMLSPQAPIFVGPSYES